MQMSSFLISKSGLSSNLYNNVKVYFKSKFNKNKKAKSKQNIRNAFCYDVNYNDYCSRYEEQRLFNMLQQNERDRELRFMIQEEINSYDYSSYNYFDVQTQDEFEVQSRDIIDHYVNKYWESQRSFLFKLLEDILILTGMLFNARSKSEYALAIANFAKLRTSGSLFELLNNNLFKTMEDIFSFETQSIDTFFEDTQSYLTKYSEICESPLYKKMYRLLMYCLSLSIFENFGITYKSLRYSRMEEAVLKKKYYIGADFIHCILDTTLFLSKKGYQCYKLGSLEPIYHSGSDYAEWLDKACELKRLSNFIGNLEPHGTNKFEFLADLKDTIEIGKAITKHAVQLGQFEGKMIRQLVSELEMINSVELTRRSAMKERKAPFSVLIYGGSSVAKSTFTKMLFIHYGKLLKLNTSSEFKYTRDPVNPYWSNFNTSQWCIQLDDIAFLNPAVASSGDPSMMEMLQVINNVPFVPTQADLADKGRTPLEAKLVLATTNTEHLNAHAYFSVPLAVQRRLPFIIDIKPKNEYLKDGCMIDSAKLPPIKSGEYPDYWIITVKKVLPLGINREKQRGKIVEIATYDNIYEFLDWYAEQAFLHEGVQSKVLDCDKFMNEVELCEFCNRPKIKCYCNIQSIPEDNAIIIYDQNRVDETINSYTEVPNEFIDEMYTHDWSYILKVQITLILIYCYEKIPFMRIFLSFFINRLGLYSNLLQLACDRRTIRNVVKIIGKRVQNKIGMTRTLTMIIACLTTSFGLYRLYKYVKPNNVKVQGSNQSKEIGETPIKDPVVKRNVWYSDNFELTSFDVSPMTISYKALEFTQVIEIIRKNCIFVRAMKHGAIPRVSRPNRAICLSGHKYLINNHALYDDEMFTLKIISGCDQEGINSNIEILVTQNMIERIPGKDLAIITIRNIPPRKDISDLFAKTEIKGVYKGVYVSVNEDGSKYTNTIHAIRTTNQYIPDFNTSLDLWMGKAEKQTVNGHCGTILLADTGFGPVIMGIHVVGSPFNDVGSIKVTQEDFKHIIENSNQIQSGVPNLSSVSKTRNLGNLHFKSPLRYISEGTANVYGSFTDFRSNHKSSVVPTYICNKMLELGYSIKHGKPIMNGWEPWRLSLLDMVRPVTKLRQDILETVKLNFIDDILEGLSKKDLQNIMVYDNVTALNGAAGVTYVDKINRSSSAGNPWKKSKKYFLTQVDPIGDLLDPVEANDEIMDRVDDCINKYIHGVRYMPNFAGQLKDEATSFKKIEAKKTRVFTSGPFDWTIVVRKYLLSFVKVVQENRFLFESGPGTIAQSTEWQDIRDFVCKFGEHKIVAGDYSKFDKRMSSVIILAAFDIIIAVCKEAGYNEEELRVVKGIAEDTAFPMIDYNGDLIETYGVNPSGHPLTVIINGLVNALYIRYTYAIINDGNAIDFKQNVSLMTYGDDMIMGVSDNVPLFHHTSIQKVLMDADIGYTMADKEAESIPYINIDEASFLKRTWRYDDDVGAYLCPLEHDSINKMLTMCVKSKTVSMEQQAISIISTAVREYFFYGKIIFETKSKMLKKVVEDTDLKHYVEKSTFPTWDELYDLFWEQSE